jgi:ArsR family transcriptional regulator
MGQSYPPPRRCETSSRAAIGLARGLSIHQDWLVRRLPLACRTPLAGSTLSAEDAAELERLLRSIADRNRLTILNMLVRAGGAAICVCEFVGALELPQQNVSYHLKQLVDAGLVVRERRGRYSYYGLRDGALEQISGLVAGPAQRRAAA